MNSLILQEKGDKKPCTIEISKKRCFNTSYEKKKTLIMPKKRDYRKYDRYLPRSSDNCLKPYVSDKPASSKVFKKESLLLPYRAFAINEKKNYLKQRSAISFHKKYEIIAADLRKRLHVEQEPDDVATITDLDEDFFVVVQKICNHKALYKTIKCDYDSLLKFKQEIGYRNDQILKIDLEYRQELLEYEISVNRFTKQLRHFDDFIAQDYEKSMVIMKEAELLQDKVQNMKNELMNLASHQFLVMSSLIRLNYRYGVQQKYGRFLYFVSPSSWRANHRDFAHSFDIEAIGFDLAPESELDTFAVMFEKLQIIFLGKLVKPVMYFEKPQDLIYLFDDIANQQLWTMVRASALSHNVPRLKEHVERAKEDIIKETVTLSSSIYKYKGIRNSLEDKVSHLKTKFFKILHGIFYESVGTPKVLKLLTDLQFCYEKVFKDVPVNFDMPSVAKALESSYFSGVKALEALHSSDVHKAIKQAAFAEERKFRMANTARQNLRRFEIMAKKLLLAFGPGFEKTGVTPKERSEIPKNYKPSIRSKSILEKRYRLSEGEIEYLTLFTDWTPNQDPTEFLLNIKFDDKNTT